MPPVERNVNGVIADVEEGDYGTVQEGDTPGSGNPNPSRAFYQNGAKVEFKSGDLVTYLEVTLPGASGQDPVIRNIKKRPR